MKKIYFILCMFVSVAMMFASCNKVETQYEYLTLDMANISFVGESNAPVTVNVAATGTWEVESSVSWLKVSDKTAKSVTITVDDNDQTAEREGKLVFTMGDFTEEVPVNQLPMETGGYMYRFPYFFDLGAVMSPNGKYVGGVDQVLQEDNTFNYQVWLIDVTTDEYIMIAEVPDAMYGLQAPQCVSDQGTIFIYEYHNGGEVAVDIDGNCFRPEKPDGFQLEMSVQGVSADGTVWVGYGTDVPGGLYYPVKWVNGVPEVLPTPDKNARGKDVLAGFMARGCSHDGSVIYGSSWDNTDFSACFWKDGEFHWAAEQDRESMEVETVDVTGAPIMEVRLSHPKLTAERTNISPNGKWLAVTWSKEGHESMYSETKFPAFINLETNKAYLFEDLPGGAKHITNEGLGFTIDGLMTNSGKVVEVESGAILGDMYDWIQANYGIATSPGSIVYMTPDMQSFISLYIDTANAMSPRTCNWFVAPKPKK